MGKGVGVKVASIGQAIMQATRPRVLFARLQIVLAVQLHHISTTVCIARYSFIQLSELWQRGVIEGSKRPQWDLKVRSDHSGI